MIHASLRWFVAATAVVALACYGYIYTHFLDTPIRSDGTSYYVYLPAWVGDGDPTFETIARDCCGGVVADPVGIHRWPETGRWLAVHPIGVAVMMLPFYLVADALSWWSNLPRDGFSPYYEYIVGVSGLVYAMAGLVVLRRFLLRYFPETVALVTLVAITFGTNLFHYAVYDSTFSHAFSFFLIAALLLLTDSWWREPRWRTSVALGALAALIVLVRHTNGIFLAIVPLYGDVGSLWHRRAKVGVMAATTFAGVLPQLLVYKWATGHWIVKSDPDGYFTFASPHIFGTLFSVERGVFFWSPVLWLAVAGFFVARAPARRLLTAALLALTVDTYLMASWYMWYFGIGYGHRAYVDVLPVFAVFLAAFLAWAAERPRLTRAVHAAIAVLVALSTFQTVQYWKGIVPGEKTTWAQYRAIFTRW